jgi:hypothetical protein
LPARHFEREFAAVGRVLHRIGDQVFATLAQHARSIATVPHGIGHDGNCRRMPRLSSCSS